MIVIKTLSNGITVLLEKMNYLHSVSFGVWVEVGSVNETRENNGISHMIEHMLFKGTKYRTAKKLADDMAAIGGNMNAYTSKECTVYYGTTLDEYLKDAIDILGDMFLNSLFLEQEIEKEKGVIMEEIDMYDDSPEDFVHEMLQKEVWKEHPLGFLISGEKEIVKTFTKEQLLAYKEAYYVGENIIISIAGNFEQDKIVAQLEQLFGKLPRKKETIIISKPHYCNCMFKRQQDIEQLHLNLAYESPDDLSESRYAISILNSILGGSDNSRLFQTIREELGIAYTIYSYGSAYRQAGLFHIYVVMNPNQMDLVLEKIEEEIKRVYQIGVTQEEILQIKEQIKIELMIGSESTRNRMNRNGKNYFLYRKSQTIQETIERLNEVKQEEIQILLNQYFIERKKSIGLVGNLPSSLDSIK